MIQKESKNEINLGSLPYLSKIGYQLVDLNSRLKEELQNVSVELSSLRSDIDHVSSILSDVHCELRRMIVTCNDRKTINRLLALSDMISKNISNSQESELPF